MDGRTACKLARINCIIYYMSDTIITRTAIPVSVDELQPEFSG